MAGSDEVALILDQVIPDIALFIRSIPGFSFCARVKFFPNPLKHRDCIGFGRDRRQSMLPFHYCHLIRRDQLLLARNADISCACEEPLFLREVIDKVWNGIELPKHDVQCHFVQNVDKALSSHWPADRERCVQVLRSAFQSHIEH